MVITTKPEFFISLVSSIAFSIMAIIVFYDFGFLLIQNLKDIFEIRTDYVHTNYYLNSNSGESMKNVVDYSFFR